MAYQQGPAGNRKKRPGVFAYILYLNADRKTDCTCEEKMTSSVFVEMKFWLLVTSSFVLPFSLYLLLLTKQIISRHTVLLLGFFLVFISGLDVYLLQSLAILAKQSSSLADDVIFLSELSFALYVLPVAFGGIGINVISHVLINHLVEAERRFDKQYHVLGG